MRPRRLVTLLRKAKDISTKFLSTKLTLALDHANLMTCWQTQCQEKAERVTPPMFLEKSSWSSEDFWVLSISYNQNLATLSFVAAPSISQVLTGPSVDELPAIQAVQEGLVVLCVLFTA